MRFIQLNSLSYKHVAAKRLWQQKLNVCAENAMRRVASFLRENRADIINLQECDERTLRYLSLTFEKTHNIFFRGKIHTANKKLKHFDVATLVSKKLGPAVPQKSIVFEDGREATFIVCPDVNLVVICAHLPVRDGLKRHRYIQTIFAKIIKEYSGRRVLFSADTNLFVDNEYTKSTLGIFEIMLSLGYDYLPRPKDGVRTTFYGMPYDKYPGYGQSVLDYVLWSGIERTGFRLKFIDPIDGNDFPVSDHAALIVDFAM